MVMGLRCMAAGLAVLLCALMPMRAGATPAGSVLAMMGECFREAPGGARQTLKLGDAIEIGDSIDVPQGARLKLRMADGSVLSAAPGTRVTLAAYAVDDQQKSRDVKLALGSGLLRAVVSSFGQPSRFEVETATGVAAVRSTDWFVDAQAGSTQVGVLEGAVSLTSRATSRMVTIPARWGARVEAGRNPVPARVWSSQEFDDVIARTTVN